MPTQTRVNKQPVRREEMEELAAEDTPAPAEHITVEDVDAWLDEIDEALGAEIQFAEAFWAGFVQKGGE